MGLKGRATRALESEQASSVRDAARILRQHVVLLHPHGRRNRWHGDPYVAGQDWQGKRGVVARYENCVSEEGTWPVHCEGLDVGYGRAGAQNRSERRCGEETRVSLLLLRVLYQACARRDVKFWSTECRQIKLS